MKQGTSLFVLAILTGNLALSASANSLANFSQGSRLSFTGSGTIVEGSAELLLGSGKAIVTSVETVGKSSVIILQGVSRLGTASAKILLETGTGVSLVVGDSLFVNKDETGLLLRNAQDELVAFVPNAHTREQVHQKRYEWKSAL